MSPVTGFEGDVDSAEWIWGGCGQALPTWAFGEWGNRLDLTAPWDGDDSSGRSLNSREWAGLLEFAFTRSDFGQVTSPL